MVEKTVHEIELEMVKFQSQQDHLVTSVDKLQSDMKEIKIAVFQAKWMIVGAIVFASLMNSELFMEVILGIGK